MVSASAIRTALSAVKDPEIPTCSITDLGIVYDIRVAGARIEIDLLPTFAGCPALDVIRADVERAARDLDSEAEILVRFVNAPPWTTDRVTEDGARALNGYGISSPVLQIGRAHHVRCPYCGSENTIEETAFGPTPCRTVRYCNGCRNPFEGFKAKLQPTASAS
jgi:ring-1,2-phenylacetyl-CoA epoxidase subunit PaaD